MAAYQTVYTQTHSEERKSRLEVTKYKIIPNISTAKDNVVLILILIERERERERERFMCVFATIDRYLLR